MNKKIIFILLCFSVFIVGCSQSNVQVTSTIDCINAISDNAADFGLNEADGTMSKSPQSLCQAEGYTCVSGSATTYLVKDGDVRVHTFPLMCKEGGVIGWNFVNSLQEQGYTYKETLFGLNCCKINSVTK